MKKFYELGSKTGLKPAEMKRSARFRLLGLFALALASLSACLKNGKTDDKPQEPPQQTTTVPAQDEAAQQRQQTLQDLVDSMDKSTGTAPGQSGKCGPYPGYPCGTKYYTVSPGDLKRA